MKKLSCYLLATVLLLGVFAASAEVNWEPWNYDAENEFAWRMGTDPAEPEASHHQYAQGPSIDELVISSWSKETWSVEGDVQTSTRIDYSPDYVILGSNITQYGDDGYPSWSEKYGPGGEVLSTVEYETLADGSRMETEKKPDGTLIGITQWVPYESEENGTEYALLVLERRNEDGDLVQKGEILPDGTFMQIGLFENEDGSFSTWSDNYNPDPTGEYETIAYTYSEYDKDGNFISGNVFNPETGGYEETDEPPAEDSMRDAWLKKDEEPVAPVAGYTWYPSNTVTSAGLAFRDEKPGLTGKWYNFTPVDLGRNGDQVYDLVAGNKFLLGKVTLSVSGDAVTVTYRTTKGRHGNVIMESEFFTFFPDLGSVSSVEPEDLGEGFKFGEPLSIENDLNGDTRVLLFVRNVATFADHVQHDMPRVRYWPNIPDRVAWREALRSLMD